MEMPKATPQHEWLKRMIGDWTYEGNGSGPVGGESFSGKETVRALGDVWIVARGEGTMQCAGESHTLVTLGYDPANGRFVGTWVGSMMSMLWVYDGELDESGNALNLYAEGPAFDGGDRTALYRDRIELFSDNERVMMSAVQTENGEWSQFMEMRFRRA